MKFLKCYNFIMPALLLLEECNYMAILIYVSLYSNFPVNFQVLSVSMGR